MTQVVGTVVVLGGIVLAETAGAAHPAVPEQVARAPRAVRHAEPSV